ncbi:AMP-binding protein [Devosia sp. 63-57]|uniref:AMP-binding protein n=1 Tax=Devosia sp. 63-57 TaxID=1895751 RepID=UPI00086B5B43|nr:AMP-binding protein [Devosia sp. 63-57]ODT50117.1 MAG: AMP-dependent synthetase [Pelagibacterium sp. SCN 63-126]ODU87416.1 MAG: AMP-dependent synthetase [Pelagibacterium sp. SCN 63-17]OJX44859.1 MAG: AMP-dependent synthetase [Devosia sp. 63-57]
MTRTPFLLHHLLDDAAPERRALSFGDSHLSYGEFGEAVRKCAAQLVWHGLARGDRVAIYLPRGLEECWAIFGASAAGGVFVPVNVLLKAPQLRHIVSDCEARVLVSSRSLAAVVEPALEGISGCTVLYVEDIAEATAPASGVTEAGIGEDLAAILYTSGSTGMPKGVMLSHRNLLAGTRIVRSYLGISGQDRILSILPFSFDYGLNQLLTVVEQGASLVICTFRFGDEIVRALRDNEITGLAGVPTIWAILTQGAPLLRKTALPHLRYITNSGGRVPEATVKALRALLGETQIFLMYGLTEAFRSTFLPPEEIERRPTSIGKAIPECEVFAVTEDGRRAAPGEPGILVHRGPTVSLGYWRRPEETARVLRPHPFRDALEGGETVCYSGDLVVEDADGFFNFVGRGDGMIKSSGYRISPTEVEEALMATGLFRQVAAIGLPDALAGQKVHAVAVPLYESIDAMAVLRQLGETIAGYMVPRALELVDALPTTPNGKVDYPTLVRDRSIHVQS